MNSNRLRMLSVALLLVATAGLLVGCSDDNDKANPVVPPPTPSTYDEVFDWTCASSADCQDVFDIEFQANSAVTV